MKNLSLLFILTFICFSCVSKKVTKTVNYNYSNVIFTPNELKGKPLENIILSIEPVDASKINNEIFDAAMRDGSYEKEYLSYSVTSFQDNKALNSRDKKNADVLSKVFTAIDKMRDSRIFDDNIAINFKEKIYQSFFRGEDFGWNGSEINVQSKFDERYANLNPYRINNKYFSLFRLTFSNNGNDIKKVDINNFQVASGNELLYPFKNEYFESTLKEENEKLKYIYRMNLPNILTMIPNQETMKYISIPAINTRNKSLTINYIDGEKITNYLFSVDVETISEEYNFSAYTIESNSLLKYQYYILKLNDYSIFPLNSNTLYINDGKVNDIITVFGIFFDEKGTISHSEITFRPKEIKKNKIKLQLKKSNKQWDY